MNDMTMSMTITPPDNQITHHKTNTILIVDDNRDHLRVMTDYLTAQNFTILTTQNGETALEQTKTAEPDIILLDVMVPGIDGFEICRRLKDNQKTKDIPIIFMTALSDSVDKVKGFKLGAVDYITKPYHNEELLARIKTHLSIRDMHKKLLKQNQELQEENTRRHRVQDALRESRERYRLLADNSTDMISRQTPEGIYRYVSPACQVLLGYKIEEMVGRSFYEFFHPDDLAEVQAERAKLTKQPLVSTITYRARRKDGSYIWLETTTRLIRDPKGRMDFEVISVSRDVTERKEAEEALQQARDELEQRVIERTAELAALNAAYERFVPHEFLRFLERDSIIDVQLGDQVQRVMTILFSDIRSFSTLSESMSPQENFNFINSFLSRISPIIRQHNGFIDKYIGDSVMALFPEEAEDALQAAVNMQLGVQEYNKHRQRNGYKPIHIGVGLHTGSLMLGTIGEAQRMESTVISDAVNLAARIEGLTKIYGAAILISESSLYNLVDPVNYHFRFLDRVKVKGKSEPVSVFEVFDGNPPEIIELQLDTLENFEKGLLHYHSLEFEEAATQFKRVLLKNPYDKAAQLHLKRAKHFSKYGVPEDWEGVTTL